MIVNRNGHNDANSKSLRMPNKDVRLCYRWRVQEKKEIGKT